MKRTLAWTFALTLAACAKAPPPPAIEPPARSASAPIPAVVVAAAVALPVPTPVPDACADGAAIAVFASPRAPRPGEPLRVLAVASAAAAGALVLHDPAGGAVASSDERHGGGPYWWTVALPAAGAGAYHAVLERAGGGAAACKAIVVEPATGSDKPLGWGSAWGVRAAWGEAFENLYSAWIEELFDAPLEDQPAWAALHEVLRDRGRNFLHDHLGQGEDDGGLGALPIQPDCADMPYFLRAYFAFKLGLPFAFSSCTRGGFGQPPKCLHQHSNLDPVPQRPTPAGTFSDFLRIRLADTVHSGTGRAPASDDGGDYYPIRLTFEGLRPGTIYADPYGHILVVAKRIPQTESTGGVLLAIDGQPDGTVARKRFWQGNFLFALDPELGSPGFKRFRPTELDHGRVRSLTNAEIATAPGHGDFSLEQYEAGVSGFYDKMDDVLSPSPMDPSKAMLERVQALEEQVKARLRSVENGQKHFASGAKRIEMPKGAAIFETTGDWEDFSTPARDQRLLIAIDIVRGFPALVLRRPERFAMPAGKGAGDLQKELEALLDAELHRRTVAYTRSDGSAFPLSLADLLGRAGDLEMGYNPNDCAEVRWGAPAGSEEMATCKRRAPGGQVAQMRKARPWFHERKRPPRG